MKFVDKSVDLEEDCHLLDLLHRPTHINFEAPHLFAPIEALLLPRLECELVLV